MRYGTFSNVLGTEESTPLEPGSNENKYCAPRIGNVLLMAMPGANERMELVSMAATPPGMPRTGGTGRPDSLWALLGALPGVLSVVGGVAVRRRRAVSVSI